MVSIKKFPLLLVLFFLISIVPTVGALGVIKVPGLVVILFGYYLAVKRYRTANMIVVMLCYCLVYAALIGISLAIDANRVVFQDIFELAKPVLILLFFHLGFSVGADPCPGFVSDTQISIFLFSILIYSGILLLLELSSHPVASMVVDSYVRDSGVLNNRAVGIFGTTYFAAAFYSLVASLGMAKIALDSRWGAGAGIFFAAAAICMIVITQSRTAFLYLPVLLFLWGCLYFISEKRRGVIVILVIILGIVLIFEGRSYLFSKFNLRYLEFGFEKYIVGFSVNSGVGSLGARLDQIEWVVNNNWAVVVGAGIGKGYYEYLESLYSLMYYRAGLIGLIIYIGLFTGLFFSYLSAYISAARSGRLDGDLVRRGLIFPVAGLMFIPALFIIGASSMVSDQIHLLPVVYIFFGFCSGRVAWLKSISQS